MGARRGGLGGCHGGSVSARQVAGVADWRLGEVEWEGVSVPGWLVRVEAGSDRELGVEGELGGVAWQRLGRATGRKKQGEVRRGLGRRL